MVKKTQAPRRRENALSRDVIIEATIALLDSGGESALTFRALAERLATGAGAIYWHIDNKTDLLTAACDAIIARTIHVSLKEATPEATIRAVALSMFDALDAHPWVGSALTGAPGAMPTIRIVERLGQQVCAMEVPKHAQWAVVCALLNYILGVGGQNAANTRMAVDQQLDRAKFLGDVATRWLQLGDDEFPFTRSIASIMSQHDDREDFIAGLDLILAGIVARGA